MTAWPRNIQRIFAFALLAVAVALMCVFALWPHISSNALQTRLSAIDAQLKDYEIVMAEGEDLLSWNNLLAKSNNKSGLLLSGATTSVAGANLQQLVLKLVTRNGGVVSQVQVLEPAPEFELIRVPVSLDLTTGTKGLREIIFDLETNSSLLFIRGLVINPAKHDRAAGQKIEQRRGRVSLKISMRIFGYIRKGSNI